MTGNMSEFRLTWKIWPSYERGQNREAAAGDLTKSQSTPTRRRSVSPKHTRDAQPDTSESTRIDRPRSHMVKSYAKTASSPTRSTLTSVNGEQPQPRGAACRLESGPLRTSLSSRDALRVHKVKIMAPSHGGRNISNFQKKGMRSSVVRLLGP